MQRQLDTSFPEGIKSPVLSVLHKQLPGSHLNRLSKDGIGCYPMPKNCKIYGKT
jgi:hypothetical protein